jgi:tRNA threonylcarbamoyladenosine biosynthesis protein TsaB
MVAKRGGQGNERAMHERACILAIETATDACSVALEHEGRLVAEHRVVPRGHHRLLLPMIDGVLATANAKRADLTLVAFGAGPGSFTGVRFAAAAAQGIALGLDLPVARISTLEVLARTTLRAAPAARTVVTALGSRANEILFAAWRREATDVAPSVEARILDLDGDAWPDLGGAEIVAAGDQRAAFVAAAAVRGFAVVDSEIGHPEACDLIPLARRELAAGRLVRAEDAIPVYLSGDRPWPKAPRAAP